MPIYEYICKNCNLEFELLLFSDELPFCPKCKSGNLIKKISLVSFKLDNDILNDSSTNKSKCIGCSSAKCSSCR